MEVLELCITVYLAFGVTAFVLGIVAGDTPLKFTAEVGSHLALSMFVFVIVCWPVMLLLDMRTFYKKVK